MPHDSAVSRLTDALRADGLLLRTIECRHFEVAGDMGVHVLRNVSAATLRASVDTCVATELKTLARFRDSAATVMIRRDVPLTVYGPSFQFECAGCGRGAARHVTFGLVLPVPPSKDRAYSFANDAWCNGAECGRKRRPCGRQDARSYVRLRQSFIRQEACNELLPKSRPQVLAGAWARESRHTCRDADLEASLAKQAAFWSAPGLPAAGSCAHELNRFIGVHNQARLAVATSSHASHAAQP
jgi:hypothetical protein